MIHCKIRPGLVCRHHSGRVYTVILITNDSVIESEQFPHTVVYVGVNGRYWSRPLSEFRTKFTAFTLEELGK